MSVSEILQLEDAELIGMLCWTNWNCLCSVCILGLLFSIIQDVPLVDLVFTRMPHQSYRRLLGSLLMCLCNVFRALVNSLV